MNTNKMKEFMKKYGYYVVVGAISVGAIVAVFLTPTNRDGLVEQPNQQVTENQTTDPLVEADLNFDVAILEEDAVDEVVEVDAMVDAQMPDGTTGETVVTEDQSEVSAETFSTTTIEKENTPFFADGDTFSWPIKGDIIVPYKDETTSHWYSKALNQTMRTFGVCISGQVGDSVAAAATGTVEGIITDSMTIASLANVGNVGEVVVIDHGNGYKTLYGLQRGTANKDLVGQVVSVGQEIGKVGQATGPFVSVGDNVYFQILHNEETINPEGMLSYQDTTIHVGMDMGHAPDEER